jgi:alginate O-acetyltransferase complex protein AlgJ
MESAKVRKVESVNDAVFAGVFAAILLSGVIASVLGFSRVQLAEKRSLSAAPAWPSTLKEWEDFPQACDRYANDHFGWRNELIALNSYLRYRLGVSASPKILAGNNGWLFYVEDENWKFFRGGNRLSGVEVRQWLDRMEQRRKWLVDRGIQLLILPAPLKETIYPEHLPYWLRREQSETQVDQVVRGAGERPGLNVIDVRQRLIERKRDTAVYQAFDSHWTAEGAFVAYTAIMEEIAKSRPGITRLTNVSAELRPARATQIQQNLTLMLGIDHFVHPECNAYNPRHASTTRIQFLTSKTDWASPQLITTGIPNTPKIMLVSDSFSGLLLPYLKDTFGWLLVTHVADRSLMQMYVEQYRPDIVLLEVQEGGIGVF